MIDLHNHLLPGVDDGAATLDEARAALGEMRDAGVETIIVTPHLFASLTAMPEASETYLARLDEAFDALRALAAAELPGLRLERGVELMLDTPRPDLSDPRLRLAGTRFVLVEFPGMTIPPQSARALAELRQRGWTPVVAHPERYANVGDGAVVHGWRAEGIGVQVNAGSLLGRYGRDAERAAWSLLGNGWVDYLSSDYHARGPLRLRECRERLLARGAAEQAALLLADNAARLLAGRDPHPVPPVPPAPPRWRTLFRRA